MMDKAMMDEMSEAMEKVGLKADMMDEDMMWGAKKMMFGVAKVKWALKEKGLKDSQIEEAMMKMMKMMMKKDMSGKMEHMHEHMASK